MKTTMEDLLKQIAPLPYRADGFDITDNDGALAAQLDYWDDKGETTTAYLVHCANNFPHLLKAIEQAVHNLENLEYPDDYFVLKTLQEALKQASTIEL